MLLEGSCHCEAVRFRVHSSHPYPFNLCYCLICRKTAGGGGYPINRGGEYATLKVDGRAHGRVYQARIRDPDSGEIKRSPAQRNFCALCAVRQRVVGMESAMATARTSVRISHRHRLADTARAHTLDVELQGIVGAAMRQAAGPALSRLPGRVHRRVARAPGTGWHKLAGSERVPWHWRNSDVWRGRKGKAIGAIACVGERHHKAVDTHKKYWDNVCSAHTGGVARRCPGHRRRVSSR